MISVKSTIGCNSLSYSSNIAMITSIILNKMIECQNICQIEFQKCEIECQKECQEYLVGGIPTPLKNMSSSVGITIPNIWKNTIGCGSKWKT